MDDMDKFDIEDDQQEHFDIYDDEGEHLFSIPKSICDGETKAREILNWMMPIMLREKDSSLRLGIIQGREELSEALRTLLNVPSRYAADKAQREIDGILDKMEGGQ